MDVIESQIKVAFIADQVFPEPPLPNVALVSLLTRPRHSNRLSVVRLKGPRKLDFYAPHAF